jgi:hypothetical protein
MKKFSIFNFQFSKISLFLLLVGFYVIFLPATALGADEAELPSIEQQMTALTIAPSVHEAVVEPGKTTSQIFELKNSSSFPLPIKCYIRTFDASDEAGGVSIPDEIDAKRFSPTSWSEIITPDFVLQPQTTRQVTLNFSPPKDLPPGGYYAIFFAEPLIPESFLSSSSLSIGGRLGSLLFLIGPGDTIEKGEIVSFDLPKYVWHSGATETKVRFSNQGNVHLRPRGKIIITNLITKKKIEFELPEFTILPGKIRLQKVSLVNTFWPGIFRADLQIIYGRDKIRTEASQSYYHLPWKSLLLFLLLLVTVLMLAFPKSRQRLQKSLKALWGSDNPR